MSKKESIPTASGVRKALGTAAKRLAQSKALKDGHIILRFKGRGGASYCLKCSGKSVRLLRSLPKTKTPPLIELIGSADSLQQLVQGKADPRVQFMRGNLRIRGDIRYISDLALELKLIKKPL